MTVRMYHPDIESLAEAADDDQFRLVWEPRGWRRAPTELVEVNETLGTNVVDLRTVDPAQLRHVAAARGVDPTGLTHEQLARRLSGDVDLTSASESTATSGSAPVAASPTTSVSTAPGSNVAPTTGGTTGGTTPKISTEEA